MLNKKKLLSTVTWILLIKKTLLKKRKNKYKSMSPSEKKVLLEKQAVCYKGMDASQKEACLKRKRSNIKHKYHAVNSPGKATEEHETSNKIKRPKYDLDYFISVFRNKIKEGPCYICCVCNRLLYRKSVNATLLCQSLYSQT